jgi:hypothetical protein
MVAGSNPSRSRFSPELNTICGICSVAPEKTHEAFQQLRSGELNSDLLLTLCKRHRLLPLFYRECLKLAGASGENILPSFFEVEFNAQTLNVLKLASETVRLSEFLGGAGIETLALKGPFLSLRLYGDVAIRPSRDIDLLIRPSELIRAREILTELGYNLIYPPYELNSSQMRFYMRYFHHVSFYHAQKKVLLELHWSLFSMRRLFRVPLDDIFSRSSGVQYVGKLVKTLPDDVYIQYLCEHGAIHQWFRLLWLRDLAGLISVNPGSIELLLEALKKDRAERPLEQAILLSNCIFGAPLPAYLAGGQTRPVRKLVDRAIRSISGEEQAMHSIGIERVQKPIYRMKLHPGLLYKLECWNIVRPNPDDWRVVQLPEWLFFLYFILRPFTWFYLAYLKPLGKGKRGS